MSSCLLEKALFMRTRLQTVHFTLSIVSPGLIDGKGVEWIHLSGTEIFSRLIRGVLVEM